MAGAFHRIVRGAIIGLLVTTTSACIVSTGGCTSEEAATVNGVQLYGGAELVPTDDGLGGCGASFTTSDDPALVIEHYRSRLEAAGWAIDPPEPLPPEGGEIQSVSLGARKGRMGIGISAEIIPGAETTFVIHVRESD